jgi:hypothetical protein
MNIMSFDPGQSTGWASMDLLERPVFQMFGTTRSPKELFAIFDKFEKYPDVVVCEDYHINPAAMRHGWAHQWDKGIALRTIGAIEHFAHWNNADFVLQQPSQLKVGCGYIGYEVKPKKHIPDHISAMAHGAFYTVKKGILTPKDFKSVDG